jgi:hypothetical protein
MNSVTTPYIEDKSQQQLVDSFAVSVFYITEMFCADLLAIF